MYRVKNWDRHFEGAKSKTYKNKTSCQLPTKHGLGYKRLIRQKDGPALFGAWCALIQVLSRHPNPRQGYCTDTGGSNGIPYTPDDLEILTDIPAKYFSKMLEVCKSHHVGWVELIKVKDSKGDQEDTSVPLNLDSDSDLNSDSDLDLPPKSPKGESAEFLERFNVATKKKHRTLPDKALRQFKARLKDGYTIDDMIMATLNAYDSDHHRKSNHKNLTPEFITRGDKLEMWLNAEKKPSVDELFGED
jgi:hypothetical protein